MRVFYAGDRGRMGADAVMMLRAAGRQVSGLNVAQTAAAAAAPGVWTPTVARLPRSAACPCEPESVA